MAYWRWAAKRHAKRYARWQKRTYFNPKRYARWQRRVKMRQKAINFARGYWRR